MSEAHDDLIARPYMPISTLQELDQDTSHVLTEGIAPIANLIPIGLSLLTGEEFSGKTSLALQLGLHIATGTPPFEATGALARHFDTPFGNKALYLALGSSALHIHTLQNRLSTPSSPTGKPNRLLVKNTWAHLNMENGLQHLHDHLLGAPNTRLIVLDDLPSLRRLFRGNDRDLFFILRRFAEQHNIAILIMQTAKRSTSLSALVDTHLHLKRLSIDSYARLEVSGRYTRAATHLLYCPSDRIQYRFATMRERVALETISAHKIISTERLLILHLMRDCALNLTPKQIATVLDLDYDCVRHILSKMVRANLLLLTQRGHYAIHPFIQPLLDAILDQDTFLTSFIYAPIPEDDLADPLPDEAPSPHDTSSNSATVHNPHPTPTNSASPHTPNSATVHNPSTQTHQPTLPVVGPEHPERGNVHHHQRNDHFDPHNPYRSQSA
ncbi:AAA family ATPase [Ktedonospora formicarum]|uniref:Uncharacterized protein n=1 Tax=Ktedonospora formicarum TaxID=2778364 RepID=A0A8J3MQ59_9CHLR|nr:AAA family ATPase [Ktedonospora formicarum]GHO42431.1 hypothetical protein KSX_05940 [Ktedonospora formicarum]